jgi:hypothetical protein
MYRSVMAVWQKVEAATHMSMLGERHSYEAAPKFGMRTRGYPYEMMKSGL